jgi:hypothetical protein
MFNIVTKHLMDALKVIAKIENKDIEFNTYLDLFLKNAKIETTVSVTKHSGNTLKGYEDFFK